MIKILFISAIQKVPWGGSEELWSQAALNLSGNHQYKVSALVKKWKKRHPKISNLQKHGIDIFEYDYSIKDRIFRKIRLSDNFHQKYFSRIKPDLVILSQGTYHDGKEWLNACYKSQLDYFIITQAAGYNWWIPDKDAFKIRGLFEYAKKVFFVSRINKKIVSAQLALNFDNSQIIFNAINLQKRELIPFPAVDKGYKLACVGRLTPNAKGQDILIELMALPKWRERNISVTFYGNGENGKMLEKLVQLNQLQNVTFKGFVEDVRDIWKDCHAIIMPSRHEGLPLAMIEAMICGRIGIATRIAGGELLEDNSTGFLADYPDLFALDKALERAWNRRDDWSSMGIEASKSISEKIPFDPVDELVKQMKLFFYKSWTSKY